VIVAGVDWTNLNVAAAFILGAVLGTVATIRLTRTLLEYLKRDRPPR
jgi:hypothetical protein